MSMKKTKRESGITLISLVITIVLLIILATVSINVLLGEGGLINQAKTAKFETEKAAAREQIEVVLLEAQTEKALNDEYDENEFLDKFVEDRLNGVWLEQDEIAYDGFIFALDRSVPKLGNYTGQDEGPRIKEIKVTGKTTNSVSIEVDARNAEGGKYTYSYKKDSEGEEAWIEAAKELEENTYTFENLEENKIYNLKVRIETSEGKIEQTINEMTGELPKGTITFDEVEWVGDGTAKVRINTSAQGYIMQYIIVKQGESTEGLSSKNWSEIESGSEIEGLYLVDTVYARLFDGKNESDYASVTVEDKIAPDVTVILQGTPTSNSISVSPSATDGQSGMKESLTYTYSIKESTQLDSSYNTPENASNISSSTYTFTGLTQGTSYDVKVEVNGDKANNVGTGILSNKTTGTVPGAEGGLQTGNITASTPTWSNEEASITLSTSTGLTMQYQTNNTTEENWQTGTSVTGLHHGDTVYARLTDGNNYGDYASVNILDGIAPNAPIISLSGTSENNGYYKSNIAVTITAGDDNESGSNKIKYKVSGAQAISETTTASGIKTVNITITEEGNSTVTAYTIDKAGNVSNNSIQIINKDSISPKVDISIGTITENSIQVNVDARDENSGIANYKYYINNNLKKTLTTNSYIFNDLDAGTSYNIKVEVSDKANNIGIATETEYTKSKMVNTTLKEGNYVLYPSPKDDLICRVLYDASSEYGLQIITDDTVNESVTLGGTNYYTVWNSYSNAITTLNNAAEKYINNEYSEMARCVGSNPTNPSLDEETNYEKDYNKMELLNLTKANSGIYWLASKKIITPTGVTNVTVYIIDEYGELINRSLGGGMTVDSYRGFTYSYKIRPVFTLNDNIKVTGGNGTKENPYVLGK